MQVIEKIDENILIVDSPIEFVLIGTMNNRRIVLAKSRDAKIDLLSSQIDEAVNFSSKKILLNLKFSKKALAVDSKFIRKSGMDRYDNLKFVWRGLANKQDIAHLRDTINMSASLMYIDINKKNQKDELEWLIAELIYLANDFNSRRYHKLIQLNFVFYSFLLIYLFVVLYIVFFKFMGFNSILLK